MNTAATPPGRTLGACVFDFDGTLVDTSGGILESFRAAFAACAQRPARTLTAAVIGPPLRQTLALLADSDDAALLDRLSAAFKAHYDSQAYRLSTVFPGVPALLEALCGLGYPLYIATNKRLHPTQLIIEHLGWRALFRGVHALDGVAPPYSDKAAMLAAVLRLEGLAAATTLYVGDRDEDGSAAAANALPFAWASWGYGGEAPTLPDCPRLDRPDDLRRLLGAA